MIRIRFAAISVALALIAVPVAVSLIAVRGGVAPSLIINKGIFPPGEKITVTFEAPKSYAASAWAGIIPSSVPHGKEEINDRHDISYQYLNKRTSGELVFTAPARPGDYDIRMHDTDDSGLEVATASFKVEPPSSSAEIYVEQTEAMPGEKLDVYFSGIKSPSETDWISIYQVEDGNEKYGEWHYLKNQSKGSLTFSAPSGAGSYEFRLFLNWPSGGYIDAARSQAIKISAKPGIDPSTVKPSLGLLKTSFAPGETIEVSFTVPGGYPRNAWVGIIPSVVEHGQESLNDRHDLAYQYLNAETKGVRRFKAPAKPGDYDLRMHDTDDSGKEVASVSFKVAGQSVHRPEISLEQLKVFTGDMIDVYYSNIPYPSETDWISIYKIGEQNQNYGEWHYLGRRSKGYLRFAAPPVPGDYEFRLFLDWPSGGYVDAARSRVIKVISNE